MLGGFILLIVIAVVTITIITLVFGLWSFRMWHTKRVKYTENPNGDPAGNDTIMLDSGDEVDFDF